MNIFITGATGFVGSYFTEYALNQGHSVTALIRKSNLKKRNFKKTPRLVFGDIENFDPSVLNDQDIIFHFASYGVSPQECCWDIAMRVNVNALHRLLTISVQKKVKNFVLIGSSLEYGLSANRYEFIPSFSTLEPIGAYPTTKAMGSLLSHGFCTEHKMNLLILRLFAVFGEGQHPNNLFPSLKKAAAEGLDFPMTYGDQLRDFIHVEDVVAKIWSVVFKNDNLDAIVQIKNIGSGIPQSLFQFCDSQWKKMGAKGSLLRGALPYRPNEIMRLLPEL